MKHEEHNLQVSIINFLKIKGIFFFAIPNGGKRNIREGARFKQEGVTAGVSDLILILKNRIIFVEVKTPKGKQVEKQKEFENNVKEMGFEYYIWRNIDEAIKFVEGLK